MSQLVLADFAGMVTSPGQLARNPASCLLSDNMLFDSAGVMRKRRGVFRGGTSLTNIWSIFSSPQLNQNVLVHTGGSSPFGPGTQSIKIGTGSGAWTTIPAPDSANILSSKQMGFAMSNNNTYVTTTYGVRRIESDYFKAYGAGMPRGVIGNAGLTGVGGSLLASGYGRAYRLTWHVKDASGVELGGAPTGRAIVRNIAGAGGFTGATQNPRITFYVPAQVLTAATNPTTSWFYRLWASRTSQLSVADPDDEMYLVAEAYLTGVPTVGGIITVDDTTPDQYLTGQSATLHTNTIAVPAGESGLFQGVVNEDACPPIAAALAQFADVMWYGNVSSLYRAQVTMLALPTIGDTITVQVSGSVSQTTTFTFKAAIGASTDVKIETGFASASNNIEATCMGFVGQFNSNFNTTGVTCMYISSSGNSPGTLFFEASAYNTTLTISTAAANWRGVSSGHNAGSSDTNANGLYFSKPYRADAVPPINFIAVGPKDNQILKLVPFRDRLFIFTTLGVWQITGTSYADFSLAPVDLSFHLRSERVAVVADDAIWAWGLEGFARITYGGVTYIHPPIDNLVESVAGLDPLPTLIPSTDLATISTDAFAVAYRSKHQVRWHFPTGTNNTHAAGTNQGCQRWFVYDTRSQKWSTGSTQSGVRYSAGAVRFSDDLLVLGQYASAGATYLYTENSGFDSGDYSDDDVTGVQQPILATIIFQWQIQNPLGWSHFQQVVAHFDSPDAAGWQTPPSQLNFGFTTELSGGSSLEALNIISSPRSVRVEVPMAARRAQALKVFMTHGVNGEYFGLSGLGMMVSDDGSKFSRRSQ